MLQPNDHNLLLASWDIQARLRASSTREHRPNLPQKERIGSVLNPLFFQGHLLVLGSVNCFFMQKIWYELNSTLNLNLPARRISVKELKLWVFFWLEGLDLIGRDIKHIGLVGNIMNDRGDWNIFWDIESESPLGISSFFLQRKTLVGWRLVSFQGNNHTIWEKRTSHFFNSAPLKRKSL